jgi:hypothetical protein
MKRRGIAIGTVHGLGIIVVASHSIYSGGIPDLDFGYDKRQKDKKLGAVGARAL